MPKYDQALRYDILNAGEYSCLKPYLQNANVTFDIGGYKGYFTEYALQFQTRGEIHFFEPVPESFQEAKNSLQYSTHSVNIIWNNCGVSYKNISATLFQNQEKPMQSSLYTNHFLNQKPESREVKLIDIMAYIRKKRIETINVMKVDIEGYEFELFEHLPNTFFQKIETLAFEYHILFPEFEAKFSALKTRLSAHYSHLQIFPSKYTDKVGLVLASKSGSE